MKRPGEAPEGRFRAPSEDPAGSQRQEVNGRIKQAIKGVLRKSERETERETETLTRGRRCFSVITSPAPQPAVYLKSPGASRGRVELQGSTRGEESVRNTSSDCDVTEAAGITKRRRQQKTKMKMKMRGQQVDGQKTRGGRDVESSAGESLMSGGCNSLARAHAHTHTRTHTHTNVRRNLPPRREKGQRSEQSSRVALRRQRADGRCPCH